MNWKININRENKNLKLLSNNLLRKMNKLKDLKKNRLSIKNKLKYLLKDLKSQAKINRT